MEYLDIEKIKEVETSMYVLKPIDDKYVIEVQCPVSLSVLTRLLEKFLSIEYMEGNEEEIIEEDMDYEQFTIIKNTLKQLGILVEEKKKGRK